MRATAWTWYIKGLWEVLVFNSRRPCHATFENGAAIQEAAASNLGEAQPPLPTAATQEFPKFRGPNIDPKLQGAQ